MKNYIGRNFYAGGRCLIFGVLILVLLNQVSAQTQIETINEFQSDLQNWFKASDNASSETDLILFYPFLLSAPELADIDQSKALRATLLLTDTVPVPRRAFTDSGRTTYEVYKVILDNRAFENVQLPRDEQRRLKRARNILLYRRCIFLRLWDKLTGKRPPVRHSRRYSVYLEFAKEKAALETRLLRESEPLRRLELETGIRVLEHRWIDEGYKEKIGAALKDFREISAKDPERFWADAESNFNRNMRIVNGISLPVTRLLPEAKDWGNNSLWKSWQHGNSSGLMMPVSIDRRWLNLEVLGPHRWSWQEGSYKQDKVVISDGEGLATKIPGRVLMQVLPVKLLVAKNIMNNGRVLSMDEPVIVGLICRVLPNLPAR
jgi:hypothetical protein